MVRLTCQSMVRPRCQSMVRPRCQWKVRSRCQSMVRPRYQSKVRPRCQSMVRPRCQSMELTPEVWVEGSFDSRGESRWKWLPRCESMDLTLEVWVDGSDSRNVSRWIWLPRCESESMELTPEIWGQRCQFSGKSKTIISEGIKPRLRDSYAVLRISNLTCTLNKSVVAYLRSLELFFFLFLSLSDFLSQWNWHGFNASEIVNLCSSELCVF